MNEDLRKKYEEYLEELGLTEDNYSFSEYKRDVWDEVNYDFYLGE